MVGDVVVHDWISLSDRSKDFLVSMFKGVRAQIYP